MDGVIKLCPSEKLDLKEMTWDDYITINVAHQELVRERIKTSNVNSELLQDWEEASKSLRS